MRRRAFLRALGAVGAGVGVGAAAVAPDRAAAADPPVALETVADGFAAPVDFAAPPGDDRRFVADQTGRLYALSPDGSKATFLDVTDRTVDLSGGYSERGLLGVAFHPGFAEKGRFYVRYSAPRRAGTPSGYSHTFVLSEFAADGETAAPDSERTLLEVPEPQSNHNGGALAFGPDGYLYVAVGDGGGAGDGGTGHVEDWYDAVPGGNGQDVTENRLGSVLRVDVDGREGGKPYAVPDDNPLVGRAGLDEHYAWGFRNPWRLSFDGSDLYVADVGQNRYEEVDRVVAGGNYGWNVREAAHCYGADACPAQTPDGDPLRPPVVEYPHSGAAVSGVAVVGGYVYRGDELPFDGEYVFADWRAGGRLFVATPTDGGRWSTRAVGVADPDRLENVLAFGRGRDGELYACTTRRTGPSGDTGAVHRLVATGTGTTTGNATTDGTDGPGGTTGRTTSTGQGGFGAAAALLGGAGGLAYRALRHRGGSGGRSESDGG